MGVAGKRDLERRLQEEEIAYIKAEPGIDIPALLREHKKALGRRVHTLVVDANDLGPGDIQRVLTGVQAYAASESASPLPPQTHLIHPHFFPLAEEYRRFVHLHQSAEEINHTVLAPPYHPQRNILLISHNGFMDEVLRTKAADLGHHLSTWAYVDDDAVRDADLIVMDGDNLPTEDAFQLARHNKPIIYMVRGTVEEEVARTLPTLGASVVDRRHIVAAIESRAGRLGLTSRYRNKRIFVLDDEPSAVKGLIELLGEFGYRDVDGCTNPQHAIAEMKRWGDGVSNEIDLLITDYLLPSFNGLEVAERAKKEGIQNVLLYSGYEPKGAFLNAYRRGIIQGAVPKNSLALKELPKQITRTFAKHEERERIRRLIKQGYELLVLLHGEAASGKSTFSDVLVNQYGWHRPLKDRVGEPRPGEQVADSHWISAKEYERNEAAGIYQLQWTKENVRTGDLDRYGYQYIPRELGPVIIPTRSRQVLEQAAALDMPMQIYNMLGLGEERQAEALRYREGDQSLQLQHPEIDMREKLTYSFPTGYHQAIEELEQLARIVQNDLWRDVEKRQGALSL